MKFCGEWEAWHNRMPGVTPKLRVSGKFCFNEGGWSAALKPTEPQGINPRMLMLDLIVVEDDPVHTEALTEVDVEWSVETDHEYDEVFVQVPDTDIEPKLIKVQIAV
jgi:hypothetical protein